jgi:hypothetical protein
MAVRPRIDFDAALAAPSPTLALREAVKDELLHDEVDLADVIEALEEKMLELRAEGEDDAEDVVTSVLDFMTGWSSARMRV